MLEKCAERLTAWLVYSDVIQEEEKEMYTYAAYSLFLLLLPVVMAAVIGISVGCFFHSIVLLVPFMLIRKFSGGYHARNSTMCFVYSCVILCSFIYVSSQIEWNKTLLLITVISVVLLCIFSPIDSENRRLTSEETKEYKKRTIILTILFWSLTVLLLFLGLSSYACSISLGIIMTAGLQLPCIVKSVFKYKHTKTLQNVSFDATSIENTKFNGNN